MPPLTPPEVHVTNNPIVVFAIVALIGGCALLALIAGFMSSRRTPVLPPTPQMATRISPPPPPPPPGPAPEAPLPPPPPSPPTQPTAPWSTSPPDPEVDDPRR